MYAHTCRSVSNTVVTECGVPSLDEDTCRNWCVITTAKLDVWEGIGIEL